MLTARYIRQMPFVGTLAHRYCMVLHAWEHATSKADVTRKALDEFFDLDDGEFASDDGRLATFHAWLEAGEPDENEFAAFMRTRTKKV